MTKKPEENPVNRRFPLVLFLCFILIIFYITTEFVPLQNNLRG